MQWTQYTHLSGIFFLNLGEKITAWYAIRKYRLQLWSQFACPQRLSFWASMTFFKKWGKLLVTLICTRWLGLCHSGAILYDFGCIALYTLSVAFYGVRFQHELGPVWVNNHCLAISILTRKDFNPHRCDYQRTNHHHLLRSSWVSHAVRLPQCRNATKTLAGKLPASGGSKSTWIFTTGSTLVLRFSFLWTRRTMRYPRAAAGLTPSQPSIFTPTFLHVSCMLSIMRLIFYQYLNFER